MEPRRWLVVGALLGGNPKEVTSISAVEAAAKLVLEYSVLPLTLEQLSDELAYLITQVEAAGHAAEAADRQRRARAARTGCQFLASIAQHLPVQTANLTRAVAWIAATDERLPQVNSAH
jgi:hypothetical protein